MIVQVFHKYGSEFRHVADVECSIGLSIDALEEAFASTNHIYRSWWENANVINALPIHRSSMFGDKFVIPSRNESWICKLSGWKLEV
jgi:hypothetical protein